MFFPRFGPARRLAALALACALVGCTTYDRRDPGEKAGGPVTHAKLPNGLELYVQEDPSTPVVSVQVWYRVGSRNEVVGKRGIAHMFEHMMFKGTSNVPPEEHARLLDERGGFCNAFTREDVTGYFDAVPVEALDLALTLEADRMRNLRLTQETIDSERQVVKEERRLRIDNNPLFKTVEKMRALAYQVHPYAWTPAGTLEDLDTVTVEDCQAFYQRWYRPDNAVVCLVGDVTWDRAYALVREKFGKLRRPDVPLPDWDDVALEPVQQEARRATVEEVTQIEAVIAGFKAPPVGHPDARVFEVIQLVLSGGESSRMHKKLVREEKKAVFAGGFAMTMRGPGLFLCFAAYLPGADAAQVEESLLREAYRLREEPVTEEELAKARNQLAYGHASGLGTVNGRAQAILDAAMVGGDIASFLEGADPYASITAEDVMRVADAYLRPGNMTLVVLKSRPAGEPPAAKGDQR